jgi:hypothetical protein
LTAKVGRSLAEKIRPNPLLFFFGFLSAQNFFGFFLCVREWLMVDGHFQSVPTRLMDERIRPLIGEVAKSSNFLKVASFSLSISSLCAKTKKK